MLLDALLGVEGSAAPAQVFAYQKKAASIFGMMGHIGGYDPIIALHAAGRLDLTPMIDARYELQRAIFSARPNALTRKF